MEARPQRIAVIVNPSTQRSTRTIEAVRRLCLETGWADPIVLETTIAEPGASQALAAMATHPDIILAAGGDGTVREVAGILAGTGMPLGIVPLGTANLFARNLALPISDLERCIRIAVFGRDRRVDVGRILTSGSTRRDAVFLVVAGFGMDANAFATTSANRKRRVGWFAYFESLTRNLFRQGGEVYLSLDGGAPETLSLWTVMIANCGRIPAGINLVPHAEPDDGDLDVVVMAPRRPADWIPIAGKILLRSPFEIPSLSYRKARWVRVQPTVPIAMQLDGDVFPEITEAIIHIAAGTLLVRSLAPDKERWRLPSKESHKLPPAPVYT